MGWVSVWTYLAYQSALRASTHTLSHTHTVREAEGNEVDHTTHSLFIFLLDRRHGNLQLFSLSSNLLSFFPSLPISSLTSHALSFPFSLSFPLSLSL